jgi:hypothetical protein
LYTQRDWDRTVGVGKVPYEYSLDAKIMEDKRAEMIRENNYGERQECGRQSKTEQPASTRDEKTSD